MQLKPFPEGFLDMENCRIKEANKLLQFGKMRTRFATVAKNMGSSRWLNAIKLGVLLTFDDVAPDPLNLSQMAGKKNIQ